MSGYNSAYPSPRNPLQRSRNAQTSSDIAVTLVGATRAEKQDATSFDATGANPSSELSAEHGHHQNEMWCGKVPETVCVSSWAHVCCPRSRELRGLHHVERQRCADRRDRMSIIGWIILGLVSSFIASRLVNHRGEGL